MIDLLISQEFISLITLSDLSFWIALLVSLLASKFAASRATEDPHFQVYYFYSALFFMIIFFYANVWLSQLLTKGAYQPIFVGRELFAQLSKEFQNPFTLKYRKEQMESILISQGFHFYSWQSFVFLCIFCLGVYTFFKSPPKWTENGISIVDARTDNIINYTITKLMVRNIFIYGFLLFISILMFDLASFVQFSDVDVSRKTNLPNVWADKNFDTRYYTVLVLLPLLTSYSLGRILRTRHRMMYGDLINYRPDRLQLKVFTERVAKRTNAPRFRISLAGKMAVGNVQKQRARKKVRRKPNPSNKSQRSQAAGGRRRRSNQGTEPVSQNSPGTRDQPDD